MKGGRVRDAIARGDLQQAAEWEAAACDRDGYHDTAELIRALASVAGSSTTTEQEGT